MMYKPKNKQLNYFTKEKYHDGGGLYIRISRQGKGLQTYRYSLNKRIFNQKPIEAFIIKMAK